MSIVLLVMSFSVFGQAKLDPTGTYKYRGKTVRLDGAVLGPYSGIIQVKRISDSAVAITFFVCKGKPSYNSGGFDDTLSFHDNTAIYTNPEDDSTCKITFKFDKKGVTVNEETENYNAACGFGYAVVADGRYRKTSSKTPVLTNALTDEEIK